MDSPPLSPPPQPRPEDGFSRWPQHYLRLPGLVFDDIPNLIPRCHRAALTFLQPVNFKLTMSWEEYYDLVQPFDDVASKLIDVFEYSIDELKQSPTGLDGEFAEIDWRVFFKLVLEGMGFEAEEMGVCRKDAMWIVYLYTRAYQNTPRRERLLDRVHWQTVNIRYVFDLLREWTDLLRERGFDWAVVFGELFGISQ